eukprot:1754341-Pyramimonas_sp.AAC.1
MLFGTPAGGHSASRGTRSVNKVERRVWGRVRPLGACAGPRGRPRTVQDETGNRPYREVVHTFGGRRIRKIRAAGCLGRGHSQLVEIRTHAR